MRVIFLHKNWWIHMSKVIELKNKYEEQVGTMMFDEVLDTSARAARRRASESCSR